MKPFMQLVLLISSIVGSHCTIPSGVLAEDKPITSSLGNPKIKLIGEMTLPSAIKKVVFEKDGNGSMRIGKILTEDGFYSVDEKLAIKSLLDLKTWNTEGKRWVFEEGISNDGNYALASCLPDPLPYSEYCPEVQYIVNLETKEKNLVKEGGGWPIFSFDSLALARHPEAKQTDFLDFRGNVLNTCVGDLAFSAGAGYKSGFIGVGPGVKFFDKLGNLLKVYDNIHQPQFRVNYNTDQIALYYCSYDGSGKPLKSTIGIYNWKGDLQHEMTLPFDPNVDLGFSPDGKYVVVAARGGWVKLLDMESTREVWSKEMEVLKYFYWHDPFPIMSDAKRFAFFTLEPVSKKFMLTIFTHTGDILGYIEINKRPKMEDYRLEFIPGTSILVFHSDKYVNLYKIDE